MWPKLMVFVRHGEAWINAHPVSEWISEKVSNFHAPLSERGRQQAKITGEYIKKRYGKFDAHFVSSFPRTEETQREMGFTEDPILDARLDECWAGIWYTMTEEEIRAKYPEELRLRELHGWFHYRPIGGESGAELELRVHAFNAYLREMYRGKRVLVVGHGRWMIHHQRIMQNLSLEETKRRYVEKNRRFPNASIAAYRCINGSAEIFEEYTVPWESQAQV